MGQQCGAPRAACPNICLVSYMQLHSRPVPCNVPGCKRPRGNTPTHASDVATNS